MLKVQCLGFITSDNNLVQEYFKWLSNQPGNCDIAVTCLSYANFDALLDVHVNPLELLPFGKRTSRLSTRLITTRSSDTLDLLSRLKLLLTSMRRPVQSFII